MIKIIKSEKLIIRFETCLFFFLYPIFFNILLNVQIYKSFVFYIIKIIFIVIYADHNTSYCLERVFKNVLSLNFFILIFIFFLSLGFEYGIKRGFIELWALYDSFKRSYNSMKKCMYDEIPNPIFIISRKQNDAIYYKNSAADKLYEKISKNTPKKPVTNKKIHNTGKRITTQSNNTITYSMSNLFERDMEELFNKEIDNCLILKKKFFYFPFRFNEKELALLKFKESSKRITFYEGDLDCFDWYKILLSPCSWKSQESVYIYKEDFISNYLGNIGYEFNSLIENIDKICDSIVESDYVLERLEKSSQILTSMNINNNPSTTAKGIPHNYSGGIRMMSRNMTVSLNRSQSNPKDLMCCHYPKFDHSIWFFFKNNLNLLYDLFMTMKVYNQISAQKYLKSNYKLLNLKNLISYFDGNFYTLSRMRNVNIKSNVYTDDMNINIDSEIFVVYEYLRVILFNLYIFLLTNSFDTTLEKDLNINVSVEKYIQENKDKVNNSDREMEKDKEEEYPDYDLAIKISINIEDTNTKFDFNDLNKIFMKYNFINNFQNELNLVRTVDSGIIIVNLILKLIYDTQLEISKEGNLNNLTVKILANSKDSMKRIKIKPNDLIMKEFNEPKEEIYEDYCIKVLGRTHKCNVEPKFEKLNLKNNFSLLLNNEEENKEEVNADESLNYESDFEEEDENEKSKFFF